MVFSIMIKSGIDVLEHTSNDIQKAIALEREWCKALHKSIFEWTNIVKEIDSGLEISPTIDIGWRTKFSKQRLHNNAFRQQIKALQAEVDHVKHKLQRANRLTPTDEKLSRSEQQKHLRDMGREVFNLKSFEKMYERQLDDTAREYKEMKEAIDTIAKDVWFNQGNRIAVQEDRDRRNFRRIKEKQSTTFSVSYYGQQKRPNATTLTKTRGSYFDLYNKCLENTKTSKATRTITPKLRGRKEVSFNVGVAVSSGCVDDDITSDESYEFVVIDNVKYKRSIPKKKKKHENNDGGLRTTGEQTSTSNFCGKNARISNKERLPVSKIPILKHKNNDSTGMDKKSTLNFETSVSSLCIELDATETKGGNLNGDRSIVINGGNSKILNRKRVSINDVLSYNSSV